MEHCCTTSERCGGKVVVAEGPSEDQMRLVEAESVSRTSSLTFHAADIHILASSLCQTLLCSIHIPASFIASYKLKAQNYAISLW